jgi:hypothetical protein
MQVRDVFTGGMVDIPEPKGSENKELDYMKSLAGMVRDNAHFRQVLQDANPALRRQVYEHIKPHLKFKPKPYFLLMK